MPLPTYPFERRRYWAEERAGDRPEDRAEDRTIAAVAAAGAPPLPAGDDLEASLAALWREVLGVGPVGRDDDFFALGGSSLLALGLLSRVEERLGAALPLSALARGRATPAELARWLRLLRAGAPAAGAAGTGAVELAARDGGTPLFFIHPIGGGILGYLPLARHLGRARPVWALPAPGLDGDGPPLRRVEALAAAHLDALRAVRPRGPYLLGGWSFGGLVAWELRRLLRAAGEEVPLLTLVDSWPAGAGALPLANGAESPLAAFTRDLAGGAAVDVRGLGDLGGVEPGSGEEPLDGHLDRLLALARSSGLLPAGAGGERVRRLWQAFTAHAEAAAAWTPQPPGGRTLLLLAAGEPGGAARGAAIAAAWAARGADPLAVHNFDATHWTLLTEPRVREAAERIDECLDEIEIP